MGKKSRDGGQAPLNSIERAVLHHVEHVTRQLNGLHGIWRSSQGEVTSEFVVIHEGSWILHLTTTERGQTVGYTEFRAVPTETEASIDRMCRQSLAAAGYTDVTRLTRGEALREWAS